MDGRITIRFPLFNIQGIDIISIILSIFYAYYCDAHDFKGNLGVGGGVKACIAPQYLHP